LEITKIAKINESLIHKSGSNRVDNGPPLLRENGLETVRFFLLLQISNIY